MIPAFIVISSMSDSLFLVIVEVDVDLFNGSKDSILISFFSVTLFYLLLFAKFTTKIVGFLYFFSTFATKHLRFLKVKTTRLFFQTFILTCFLQINLVLHTRIVLFDVSMTYFLSFVSINFSFLYLLKGGVNKSQFSHLMLNPLACDA